MTPDQKAQLEAVGICTTCLQPFVHAIDEPFADCGCGTTEWAFQDITKQPTLIQLQFERHANPPPAPRDPSQDPGRSFMRTKHLLRGFTLIELLVVIAIVGILAVITIANMNGGFEEKDVKGHRFLREVNYYRTMPLFHDPECPKCKAAGRPIHIEAE